MAKKIQAYVKLQVPAGKANPSPPIGPALGQQGVNIMEFCKQFNARTQKMEAGMPIPVVITVFQDRSFTFVTKTPPVSYFLKKAAGIESGAKTVGTQIVGKVTKKQVEEIAKQKMPDLNCDSVESAMNNEPDNKTVKIKEKIPVFIVYFTTFMTEEELHFGPDLYSRDDDLIAAIKGGATPSEEALQAAAALRRLASELVA